MDIKKIVAIAALVLLAIIGYNYYSSAQSEKARAVRMTETEALRASIPQPASSPIENTKSEPSTRILSDDEIAAANKGAVDAANRESIEASKKQICDSVNSVSESAMKARLNGVPIQTALETLDSANNGSDAAMKINKMYTAIITDAYRKPNYSTDKYKEDAIREFALANYLACVDAVAKW